MPNSCRHVGPFFRMIAAMANLGRSLRLRRGEVLPMESEEAHSREDVVFALFDGDYDLGFGALVNSLFKYGFRGLVYAGYRGGLPAWAGSAGETAGFHQYDVGDSCAIRFVKVEFAGHLTNHKPAFMLS